MRIEDVPFMTTDWHTVSATTHPGTSGAALWRTVEQGNIRVRMVSTALATKQTIGAAAATCYSFLMGNS